ncbi:MAG: hypothetical protein ACYSSO_08735 [Planctomycetota bacterium]|jgi:hypothetical protein
MTKSDPNSMAEFFERLGHKVIKSESAWWYDVQPKVLLSLPYYKLIEPSPEESYGLLNKQKLRAIRHPTTLGSFGFTSTLAVNTNPNYNLSCQHQKARNQTRRGMENCIVEEIDFDYLVKDGLSLNQDTAARQGRESQYANPDYWRKYCMAAAATSGVSAWGAFVEGQLAAFLVAIEVEDWVEWVVNHSAPALLKKYPNNALAFRAAQHFFQKRGCRGICYGLGSLEPTPALDHFKQRMGWTLQPIKQHLIFSKKMRFAFSFAREPSLKVLSGIFPKNYAVRKATAMIRLYRQQTHDVPTSDR